MSFRACRVLLLASLCTACGPRQPAVSVPAVLDGYRSLAHAAYTDSLHGVESLQRAVGALSANPSVETLDAARSAWRSARVPYAQTEALRFGNWFVDEWEVQVNAWPVDEGFIDYVQEPPYAASPTNPLARANLIASQELRIGGAPLRTEPITATMLGAAQERSDSEANVAAGYHAIEFLLWGQDLHGYGAGSGQRPWTDFALTAAQCTDGQRAAPLRHCQRRREFLIQATEALRLALAQMAPVWAAQPGSYGDRLVKGNPQDGLRRMIFGLATMGGAELAGERMRVALLAHAPEEEQDCFSDDTHNSLAYNALGVENFYFGRYRELNVKPSLADLARATDAPLAARLEQAFGKSREALRAIQSAGDRGNTFDRLIDPQNPEGEKLIETAITALEMQTALLEQLGQRLKLGSLDPKSPASTP